MRFSVKVPGCILVLVLLSSCSPKEETRTELDLLGTTSTVTVYAGNPASVLDKSFARVADIDRRMSSTDPESEVTAINRNAGAAGVEVSRSTFEVVQRGLYYSSLGEGRFDITIGPLVDLWGIGKDTENRVPSDEEIEQAVSLIDYSRVSARDGRVALDKPGMAVDLGGIAKGYAADEIVRVFRENGVEHGLINLGGNIHAHGTKPDGSPWRIGVQDPNSNRGTFIGVIRIADRAVVTSGPYERFFIEDGQWYHHILDPFTGFPVENGLSSVTIVAKKSIDADALSTLVFVMGRREGLALIESLSGIETLIVTDENRIYASSGIDELFTLTDDSFELVPDKAR